MEISIVVPVYNEEENIELLYESIISAMRNHIEHFEIILVNDGSTDTSPQKINTLVKNDSRVHAIHFIQNYGQSAAILAGMKKGTGTYIALIDADLQTDPKDIFTLLPYLIEFDFVNGKRKKRQDSFIKKISSTIGNTIRNFITNDTIEDTGCPMKLFKQEIIGSFFLFKGMHRFLPTLAKINHYKVIEVPVTHRKRKYGISKYGILNRGLVGLMDAFMIGWIKKRSVHYHISGGK